MYQKTFAFPQMISRSLRKTQISTKNKSINECLGILLRTRPGELLGDPNYGCYLIERVFRYQGLIVESLIKEDIIQATTKYEPRVSISPNDITLVSNNQLLQIYITYTIKETGEVNSYNLELSPEDNPFA